MPLEVHRREVEGITILELRGRLVAGEEATMLREELQQLREQGKTAVILDLRRVSYIDSTGLGALVMAHSTFKNAGGAMKLLNVSKRSAELLILTKLATVLEIYDEEQAAVNSFFPGREVWPFDILEFVQGQQGEGRGSGEV